MQERRTLKKIKDSHIQPVLRREDQIINKLKNPWPMFQLKIRNAFERKYKQMEKLWKIRWSAHDPDFKPSQLDLRFKTWTDKGLQHLTHL